VCANIEITR